MRKQIYLLLLIGGGCLGGGCQKVEMPVQYPFASEPGPQTELDQWLSEEFTRPYNIEVGYTRTPYRETDWPDNLPPNREKIRPLLEALKALWIVPFEQAGGTPFMKEYVPRQILLWGDVNLNSLQIGEINTSLGEAVLPVFGVDRFLQQRQKTFSRMCGWRLLLLPNGWYKDDLPYSTSLRHSIHRLFIMTGRKVRMYPKGSIRFMVRLTVGRKVSSAMEQWNHPFVILPRH